MDSNAVQFTIEKFVEAGRERREREAAEAEERKQQAIDSARAHFEAQVKEMEQAILKHLPFLRGLVVLPEFKVGSEWPEEQWLGFDVPTDSPLTLLKIYVDRDKNGWRVNSNPAYSPLAATHGDSNWREDVLDADYEIYYRRYFVGKQIEHDSRYKLADFELAIEHAARNLPEYWHMVSEAERATNEAREAAENALASERAREAERQAQKVKMADEGQVEDVRRKPVYLREGERVAIREEVALLDALAALCGNSSYSDEIPF